MYGVLLHPVISGGIIHISEGSFTIKAHRVMRHLFLPILLLTLLGSTHCFAQIQNSVGVQGANERVDVETVQRLLNSISDLSGGPESALEVDGKIGPKTIAAIKRFQNMQLGLESGKIDPGQATELRLLRLNGIHEVLGTADSADEKKLAVFTTMFDSILVNVAGKSVSVRPPYHINTGKRKAQAEKNRTDDPQVNKLINDTVGRGGAIHGKATPEEIQKVLQAAIDANLVMTLTPDGMRHFLARYGLSTDCSGLASRGCNLLFPDNPLNVVNKANTAYLAKLTPVESPADLKAGDLMVVGGSHVRLLTDVDKTFDGIEFTSLESTASNVLPNGSGIGEKRWRFPKAAEFSELQQHSDGGFVDASIGDRKYTYTSK